MHSVLEVQLTPVALVVPNLKTVPVFPTAKPVPVMVTVWGVRALAGVKVSEVGETVPSVVSELLKLIFTLAVGVVVKTTVKVASPPPSVVTRPDVGDTVIPGVSLSALLTEWIVVLEWLCQNNSLPSYRCESHHLRGEVGRWVARRSSQHGHWF